LLLEAQDLSGYGFVVGIKNLADCFGRNFFMHGVVIVAFIEGLEIERFDRFRGPQPEKVRVICVVAGDGNVVRNTADDIRGNPTDTQSAVLVVVLLGVAAGADIMRYLSASRFPWATQGKPFVGLLDLPPILDLLLEQTEFVANAVAYSGDVQRGERIHVAGGETAQAAVAQTGFGLVLEKLVEALAELGQCSCDRLANVMDREQIVTELRTDEEFRRQVADDTSAGASGAAECLDPILHHAIANGVGQRHVPVIGGR